jgi:hypothetical protein
VGPGGDADQLVGHALGRQRRSGDRAQFRRRLLDPLQGRRVERRFDRLLAHDGRVGETDAERREHPGHRWDDHRADVQ